MTYSIQVYGKNRDIPWERPEGLTHIHLMTGAPKITNDKEMVEHIRKFHAPERGRGIEIKEIADQKPIKSLDMAGMKALADSVGVEYTDGDSRNAIMKRIKVVQNG